MRVGIFGGTFDPLHLGHLVLAEQCREQCQLDEVRFFPAGNPPHKSRSDLTAGKLRAEMVQFAIAGHPQFRVDDRELRRSGPSFTVDTLRELAAEDPDAERFLLVGADSVWDLPKWRDPLGIAQLATIVAVNRAGQPPLEPAALTERLGAALASHIQLVTMPDIRLSSREIRARVQAGQSIRYLVPRAVEMVIEQGQLYRYSSGTPG